MVLYGSQSIAEQKKLDTGGGKEGLCLLNKKHFKKWLVRRKKKELMESVARNAQ
jgi:hypothetical protein